MSTGHPRRPTRVRAVVPGLRGRGVLLAAPTDADRIRRALESVGFAVAEADLRDLPEESPDRPDDMLDADSRPTSLRAAQDAIARALRLPETAGRNLDALVDSLRDLASWWPHDQRVVLLLHGAEMLVESDLPGWHELTEILRGASAELWRNGGEGDRAFETVALVHRHGVPSLPRDDAEAPTMRSTDGAPPADEWDEEPTTQGWPS